MHAWPGHIIGAPLHHGNNVDEAIQIGVFVVFVAVGLWMYFQRPQPDDADDGDGEL
jgi:hypothetical protein